MRQCKCGGVLREYALTGGRVVWTCNTCGRREIIREHLAAATEAAHT